MKKGIFLMVCFVSVIHFANAQKVDTTNHTFKEWYLRINPFSFLTRFGSVQLGVETIVDKQAKLYLATDIGFHFINNASGLNNGDNEKRNPEKMIGYSIKPEIKLVVSSNKKRPMGLVGFETYWQKVGIANAGWFGMDELDATGSYPYFKHQAFREQITDIGGAIKYHHKLYFHPKKNHHLELFIGLGIFNRNVFFKNATGKLVQPDHEMLVSEGNIGMRPQLPAGMRILIHLK